MAIDPNTGQTIIPIQGGANLAGFVDPSVFGQVQAGQGQNDQRASLAHALMQQGYIPNSGIGGALTQFVSALAGMKMLQDSQASSQELYTKYAQAQADAQKAKHTQDEGDKDAAEARAIKQATGIKEGETQIGLKYGDQTTAQEAKKAGAVAGATADAQQADKLAQIAAEGKNSAAVAQIGANATKGRAYPISDAAGNTKMVALQPDGSFKEVYSTPSAGGGKLTPTQTALNNVDEEKAKQLQVRQQAATQLQGNLYNWASQYTGAKPEELQAMTPQQIADRIKAVPLSQAAMLRLNPQQGGLDAISNDIGINAAGTKRPNPTDAIIAAEQNNTLSRGNLPGKNATIFLNHINDIQNLQRDVEQTTKQIQGRQAPGTGSVPQAQAGPTNPQQQSAPTQTAINPKTGQRIGLVNGQWVPVQ